MPRSFLEKLPLLTTLFLDRNPIKFLPEEIGDLQNLADLNLRDTHIEGLPKSMDKLEKLETLNLTGTFIKAFPEEIANTKISTLYLPTFLNPERLGNLKTSLKKLFVGNAPTGKLSSELENLTGLTSLYFFQPGDKFPQWVALKDKIKPASDDSVIKGISEFIKEWNKNPPQNPEARKEFCTDWNYDFAEKYPSEDEKGSD